MRANKPISVTLGAWQVKVDQRVKSGAYSSASEVVRAGLRALDREDEVLEDLYKRKIHQSLADPRPDIPLEEVFERLERKHAANMKAAERDT